MLRAMPTDAPPWRRHGTTITPPVHYRGMIWTVVTFNARGAVSAVHADDPNAPRHATATVTFSRPVVDAVMSAAGFPRWT